MALVKNENYLTIQGWMVNELGLTGNQLLVYAVIYGFSQINDQWFTGSLKYIAEWSGVSKLTVIRTLQVLIEKGLIEKRERLINNVKFCDYRCADFDIGGIKMIGGGIKMIPHNINNNINSIKERKINKKKEKDNEEDFAQTSLSVCEEKEVASEEVKVNEIDEAEKMWDEFYAEYPRKQGKKEARKKFKKICKDENIYKEIIEGLRRWKQSKQWSDVQYIPYCSTWLNQERWKELPLEYQVKQSNPKNEELLLL